METKRPRKRNDEERQHIKGAPRSLKEVRGSKTKGNVRATDKKHDATRSKVGGGNANKKRSGTDSDRLTTALAQAVSNNEQLLDRLVQRIADAVFDRLQKKAEAASEHSAPALCIGQGSEAGPNECELPLEFEEFDDEGTIFEPESVGDPEEFDLPPEPDEFDEFDDFDGDVTVVTVANPRSEGDLHQFKSVNESEPFDEFAEDSE